MIAETGAGQHGVASATACALLGLECVVYMGTEDMRRQAPNVERMRLLGADGRAGRGGRADAQGGGQRRDPRLGHQRRRRPTTSSARRSGRRPYPALVRDLQRVIGDEAREQALAAEGALPARVIACVGGGSNAIGTFVPFLDDAEVELIGVEAAGEGIDSGRHGASLTAGRTGVLHGALSSVLADDDGQILEAHSVSAGLDYPGRRARSTPTCATPAASATSRSPTTTRCARFGELARLEGIIPALEPRTRSRGCCDRLANRRDRTRGRLRRRHPERPRRQGPRRGRRSGSSDG